MKLGKAFATRFLNYNEDSMIGTPFVQSLVSHLHKNPAYKLHSASYCVLFASIKTVPIT